MKILLIYPRTLFYPHLHKLLWVPLSLSFIASVLRKEGHQVSIFDRYAIQLKTGIGKDRLNAMMLDHIKGFQPNLIGFNTVSPLIADTVECAALIRKTYSGLMIAGGHHTTTLPELTLRKIPELDGVVEGEGEMVMMKMAKGENPERIPGFWWRKKEGAIVHTPPKQMEELDQLPLPALDLLDMAFYTKPSLNSIRGHYLSVAPILTSRGCTNQCDFCAESLTYGRGVRFHNPEYVLEWMKKVWVDYKVEGIYFYDNNFLVSEERAQEICEKILSTGLNKKVKWAIQARVNHIHSEILKLLKKAGCILIELGIESALQSHLDRVRKGTTVSINEKAVALCQKEGLHVHAFMMTGFEGEILSDLEKELHWLKQVKPDSFSWFPLGIHPGTFLYQKKGNGFFEKNEWTEEKIGHYYKEDHLSSVPKEEREDFMKQYFIPYQKWNYRFAILRVNPLAKLIPLLAWRIKKYLEDGMHRFKQILTIKKDHLKKLLKKCSF